MEFLNFYYYTHHSFLSLFKHKYMAERRKGGIYNFNKQYNYKVIIYIVKGFIMYLIAIGWREKGTMEIDGDGMNSDDDSRSAQLSCFSPSNQGVDIYIPPAVEEFMC